MTKRFAQNQKKKPTSLCDTCADMKRRIELQEPPAEITETEKKNPEFCMISSSKPTKKEVPKSNAKSSVQSRATSKRPQRQNSKKNYNEMQNGPIYEMIVII
eukprot:gene10215-2635_t